jgi:quercetin dioxygenase-like cupin family protein
VDLGAASERRTSGPLHRISVDQQGGDYDDQTCCVSFAKVTSLMSKALAENPGKEALMITVEYPPGSVDPVHRHNAQAFVYVLEGSIVMQVRGGKEVTLTPGQTFYEGPDDVHVVGRNASQTKPAKFVVFFVKDKGAPIVVPEK